ncbi:hypothetical protein CON15_19280 [Bacillus cereus]|uniref:Fur-regulated basic protein FbpA n=1 Tax=Bacillus thuringiensis TaxID=1428 RepID=A0AB36VFE6_BACTU|nr:MULTISPECIES: hypothetical protein [Bacillus cereus group]PDZ55684.1 hypothetical protein CON15_19280 [Bacillus cereus]PES54458.1 hypothetical protein CN506_20495 [Bacillus thuringiensis]PFO26240.1 hypothetical protein COJ78_29495 [Bacillus thuringiensis]PFS40304.1 hypothetical protein COK48_00235 [Bacillus thuringiensis]PFS58239.1 hypothetical protein COK64_17820 [Bacillus thuringiensis]
MNQLKSNRVKFRKKRLVQLIEELDENTLLGVMTINSLYKNLADYGLLDKRNISEEFRRFNDERMER